MSELPELKPENDKIVYGPDVKKIFNQLVSERLNWKEKLYQRFIDMPLSVIFGVCTLSKIDLIENGAVKDDSLCRELRAVTGDGSLGFYTEGRNAMSKYASANAELLIERRIADWEDSLGLWKACNRKILELSEEAHARCEDWSGLRQDRTLEPFPFSH